MDSDSTCRSGESAMEREEPILGLPPPDSFTCRARSAGVVASQSLAVLSQLTVRIRAPSGLNAAHLTASSWSKEAISLPQKGAVWGKRVDPGGVRIIKQKRVNDASARP